MVLGSATMVETRPGSHRWNAQKCLKLLLYGSLDSRLKWHAPSTFILAMKSAPFFGRSSFAFSASATAAAKILALNTGTTCLMP